MLEAFAYHREEWISGKFRRGSKAIIRHGYYSRSRREWTSEERCRTQHITCEIEIWTDVELPRRRGCPYFAHLDIAPADWNWRPCATLIADRINRMRGHCNRKCPTVDQPMGIFVECIFQACVARMVIGPSDKEYTRKKMLQDKDSKFLYLCLTLDVSYPVLAHTPASWYQNS